MRSHVLQCVFGFLALSVSACGPSLQAASSGQVGCAEHDIAIENDSPGWGSRTWTAVCHGRRFFCSAVVTGSGKYYSNSQVNCSAEHGSSGETSAKAADTSQSRSSAQASPGESSNSTSEPVRGSSITAAAPTSVAGIAFGATLDETGSVCTKAGKDWKQAEGYCSGTPTDIGIAASVRVRTCQGKVCVIELTPTAKAGVAQTFLATKDALTKKYGTPESGKRNVLPGDCSSAVSACLESGRAKLEFVWKFPGSESINLSIGKDSDGDSSATMHLRYSARPPAVQVNAQGL